MSNFNNSPRNQTKLNKKIYQIIRITSSTNSEYSNI